MENPFCKSIPAGTQLIETFALRAGAFIRLDMHLQRMQKSAAVFGYPFNRADAEHCVQTVLAGQDLRCRLTLNAAGVYDITAAPLTGNAAQWVLALSDRRLAADDPWLRHKSTQRAIYDETRGNMQAGVDEVIFMNTDGAICEGTITNIFIKPDDTSPVLLTPALKSGVLPGVLRQEMLQNGQVIESDLTLQDVQNASALWVGNSLRGLIRAVFT